MEYRHIEILKSVYGGMRTKNPHFSMNAFARFLGLPQSQLNEIIKRKCGLSEGKAQQFVKKLQLSEVEEKMFILSVKAHHSRSQTSKELAARELKKLESDRSTYVELEVFNLISSWHHFAILELLEIDDFKSSASWIANKLGLDLEVTKAAISRLKKLGFLKVKEGEWVRHDGIVETGGDVHSRAIKKFHSQVMALADQKLHSQPVARREFTSANFVMDASRMPEAKEKIRKFQREMIREFCNKGKTKDSLVCMNIQLFPLTTES